MTETTNDRYITVKEAAVLAGREPQTIRRWFYEGRLTRYRVGPRAIRVRLSELEALITPVPVVESANR